MNRIGLHLSGNYPNCQVITSITFHVTGKMGNSHKIATLPLPQLSLARVFYLWSNPDLPCTNTRSCHMHGPPEDCPQCCQSIMTSNSVAKSSLKISITPCTTSVLVMIDGSLSPNHISKQPRLFLRK